MRIRDIMTEDPVTVTPDQTVRDAARLMIEHDCGAIPVVEDGDGRRLIGIITDRDIAVRGVAEGQGPDTVVGGLMTVNPTSAREDDEVETVRTVMVREQVRRVPVVDGKGRLVGIVAQADVAREDAAASDREVGRIVEAISEPNPPS